MDPTKWIIREIRVQHDGNAKIAWQTLCAFGISGLSTEALNETAIALLLEALADPPPGTIGHGVMIRQHLRDGPSIQFRMQSIEHTLGVVSLERTIIRIWFSLDVHSLRSQTIHTPVSWRAVIAERVQEMLIVCDVPNLLPRALGEARHDQEENAFSDNHVMIFLD